MHGKQYCLTVCASGGGGNFQALLDARFRSGFKISALLVDRACGAESRAKSAGVPVVRICGLDNPQSFTNELIHAIPEETDLVVLAGFMPIIPARVCEIWNGKMINTHPSLLPKFGGRGMYGVKVQEAVFKSRETYAGCTVHYVNSTIDGGEIILQKKILVDYSKTPWELGGQVFLAENELLVEAVEMLMDRARRKV